VSVLGKARPEPPRDEGVDKGRAWIARGFTRVEDVVYVGLGLLLAGSALALLVSTVLAFVSALFSGALPTRVIGLLDQILLVLMIVEILYTVQVSFREHALIPEPFLVVGLIAGIRRTLVLTAEFSELLDQGDEAFRNAMLELGLLTALIVGLVVSLALLRQRADRAVAGRAH
jgi:uncharacterized membrane protein (DUF373 family)